MAIKVGLSAMPPLTFAGMRFIIAWGVLMFYAFARKASFPRDRVSWQVMLVLGLTQIVIPYGLTFWGEQYMTAGLTSLLFATLPFFVVVFAHFMIPSESLTAWKLIGMLVSFIGVTLIFSGELTLAGGSFWGGLAVVAGAGSAGYANVVGKKYSTYIDPTVNVVVQMGVGAVLLTLTGILLEAQVPLNLSETSIFVILYLSVVGSAFGFLALYWLFTRMEVTKTSLFTFITPIVAVLLGWFILGEKLNTNVAVGGSLILVGVVLVNQTRKTG